jgi:uncharacterized protein (DUF1778 family)
MKQATNKDTEMTPAVTQDTMTRRAGRKTERLEARVTAEQKALFVKAAALRGCSLTDFLVNGAQELAARTIREHEIMTLSARDSQAFVPALLEAPAPGAQLRKAARRYKKIVQS